MVGGINYMVKISVKCSAFEYMGITLWGHREKHMRGKRE